VQEDNLKPKKEADRGKSAQQEKPAVPSVVAEGSFAQNLPQLRLLASVFDSAQEGIVITETDLDPPGPRILAVNPSFCRISGYAAEEVLGKTPRILQGPRTDRSLLDRIKPTLRAQKIFRGETYNYRKNGEEFLMRWYITPVFDESQTRVTHYVAMQQDVTEEARLRSIAQTVNAMDNMSYVFAGVRHELGNRVNSTKAALTLLRKHFDSLPRDKVISYLDAVLGELERIEYLLETLRTFSAHETVKVQALSIRKFMDQFLAVLDMSFKDKSISFDCILPEELGFVHGDSRALHQVLLNLVANGVDAVENRSDGALILRVESRGGRWLVRVEDNGVGMTVAQINDLFKPFRTTKPKGTGLGLVVSQKLVTQMGGFLHFESQLGVGTVATISLGQAPEPSS